MQKASIVLDRDFAIGSIDSRLYSAFVEHLGRCVYGGIYDPGHPKSDEYGFRKDVLELVSRLGITAVRYPGGNFVSGFNWEDSVGPERPARLDLAWKTTETNEFGLHEFNAWLQKAGAQMMYAVNLGTRGPDAARNVVEYCNHPGGTYWSDLRRKNGLKQPMDIKLWCLGNEMDGPWQMGHREAAEYGRVARESAKLMKWVDPSIELVACGSSSSQMRTFGDWELAMLEECCEQVDFVSLHRYYGNPSGNTPDFLASTLDLDGFIKTVCAICDAVTGKKHLKKRLHLSFDEYNVWYHSRNQDQAAWARDKWGKALPLLEDEYNFEDALLVGLMLITFLKNADRVKIACMAQLVNVIAPIMTNQEGAWMQTIYWPLYLASKYMRGESLRPLIASPCYESAAYGPTPMIDAAAAYRVNDSLALLCVNRGEEALELNVDLRAFASFTSARRIELCHQDMKAVNTFHQPQTVAPHDAPCPIPQDGRLVVGIPARSLSLIELK